MKAVIYDDYGTPDVLVVREVPPPPPHPERVRVAVQAAALNPKDVLIRKGRMRWLVGGRLPKIPGYDVAGTLLDPVGSWGVGTPVFGMIQDHSGGGCAEVASLRPDEIARIPNGLTMEEAASLPLAGLTALQGLRDCLRVRSGESVLINGASGGVGTLAVQIARALGADVTAVSSARNHPLVQRLGAEHTIDYNTVDVTGQRVDHVFDVYGNLPWTAIRDMARIRGCTTVPRFSTVVLGVAARVGLSRNTLVVVKSRRRDLEQLSAWVEDGSLQPVVDKVIPFEESAVGHTYLETRRARGKVVVRVAT